MASRKTSSLSTSIITRLRTPQTLLRQPSPPGSFSSRTLTVSCASLHLIKRAIRIEKSPLRISSSQNLPGWTSSRLFSTTAVAAVEAKTEDVVPPDYLSEAELKIFNKLKDQLQPVRLEVQDISGGCGSMYGLDIVSPKFKGLTVIKQHKLVNSVLADEIKGWHGVQLKTKAP